MFQATADGYIQKKQNYGTSCDGSREQSRHAYVEGLVPRHNMAAHRRRLADEVVPVHGRANKGRQQLLRTAWCHIRVPLADDVQRPAQRAAAYALDACRRVRSSRAGRARCLGSVVQAHGVGRGLDCGGGQ